MRNPIDDQRRREIVQDSEKLGTAEAAKKHGVSARTVERYRAAIGIDVRPATPSAQKRVVAFVGMRHEYAQALKTLLDRILVLASTSDNLFHVSGAFKVLHDAHVATEILDSVLKDPNASAAGTPAVSAHADAQRKVVALFQGRAFPMLRGDKPPDESA